VYRFRLIPHTNNSTSDSRPKHLNAHETIRKKNNAYYLHNVYVKKIYARVLRYRVLPPSCKQLARGKNPYTQLGYSSSLWIIIARLRARLKRDNGKIPLSRVIYVLILSCSLSSPSREGVGDPKFRSRQNVYCTRCNVPCTPYLRPPIGPHRLSRF